jgi:uncharacterized iron-regulated membrane protein
MKVFFRRIHLYLSLAAGLVILTACLTGAILVFEKDLQMGLNKHRYYVEASGSRLSAEQLIEKVKTSFPGHKVSGIKLYKDTERSAEVAISAPPKKDAQSAAKPEPSKPQTANPQAAKAQAPPQRQPGFTVFMNPYTGEVLEKYSYQETFFYQVFALHRWLLGGQGSIGKYIVGISTLIFLFILITGIILWWPRTRRIMVRRLKIKWNSGWKRVNHDMHLVFGFYSAIFLFILAFTGLAWSFEWFNNGIYKVTNSPLKQAPPPQSVFLAGAKRISPDEALSAALNVNRNAEFYQLSLPKDSSEVFSISSLSTNAVHEGATDAVYVDQYSGKVAGTLAYSERSLGARVRSTFKPVHTGSIWGWPTKILAFIVCLMGVTFPITGTIMWLNRTRKKPVRVASQRREDATATV